LALHVADTGRLSLRHLALTDAAFILELVNDPDWLRNIGDRDLPVCDRDRRGPAAVSSDLKIRAARPADFGAILALNEASVAVLSPLSPRRLADLHAKAALHRVAELDGEVTGFLLAFREGADYDSPNYRWFAARYPMFLYVDRVVVSQAARGSGIGALLYRDLFSFAASSAVDLVTCEFDVDPPNPASERFHARFGFHEVGRQWLDDGRKQVSLQAASVQKETR
jgi:hypothetical protein